MPPSSSPAPALALLGGVAWHGVAVPGERPRTLLARLTLAAGRLVSAGALVEELWADADRPASPGKALQVVVSRTRSLTGHDVVVRGADGYRLGLTSDDVDALRLLERLDAAAAAETAGDAARARALATGVLDLAVDDPGEATGALAELRRHALAARERAAEIAGRAASALGDHTDALALLEAADGGTVEPTEATLVALLRSEAAVRGAGPALERYERHRRALADAVGADPGPALQAVHAELLARDRPERHGLRHDASSLVGRSDDVASVTALLRAERVVSLVGPGGLGKTRLAHVVSAASDLPVVRFVELVGVTRPDDVVGEVGSALGVRDSVGGSRVLTAEQRQDVRARVAQQVDRAPTLLVLDNCEHLVGAVADLVAYLVAVAPRLRVLTTTRAPLAIAAEHVYALSRLEPADAVRLFGDRAVAARPGVALDADAVTRVVSRLDGLPLAVELAAAKVRAMSVEDIGRRLDDRFALLRGGDRAAPDRHRTLLAVIQWSWDLLEEPERAALARLSVFADGFTLEAAERVLADLDGDGLDVVATLADQSLLTVVEHGGGVRYRMLETVREFGHLRLRESGSEDAARAAVAAWARGLAAHASARLYAVEQVEAIDAVAAEESNLADVLHRALGASDVETVVVVLAALGGFWTIRGEHARAIAVTGAADRALRGWSPPPALVDATVMVATGLLLNTAVAGGPRLEGSADAVERYGPQVADPALRALATVLGSVGLTSVLTSPGAMAELFEHPDRRVAMAALQWSSHGYENAGDHVAAVDVAERALALWCADDGPWTRGMLLTQLAGLHAQLGHHDEATRYARDALPVLDRLGAADDAIQLRSVVAAAEILAGRLDEAEALVRRVQADESAGGGGLGGAISVTPVRAELSLAHGRTAEGLALYREAVERLRELRFPGVGGDDGTVANGIMGGTAGSGGIDDGRAEDVIGGGTAPWVVFGTAAALMAHVHAGVTTGPDQDGADLRADLVRRSAALLDPGRRGHDYPIAGLVAVGIAAWELAPGRDPAPDRAATAVRLLALADRCGYSRFTPSLAWDRVVALAEAAAPGALAREQDDVRGLRGPDLLVEVRAVVDRLA